MRYVPSFVFSAVISCYLSGCSGGGDNDIAGSPGSIISTESSTTALFNPGKQIFPIPNDFLFSGQIPADGTMFAGDADGNPVIAGIDALDGNSVIAPIDIEFSDSLDASQTLDAASFIFLAGDGVAIPDRWIPNPSQNVFLLPLVYPSGDGLLQAQIDGVSVEVPSFAEAIRYQQAAALQDGGALSDLVNPTARAEIISLDGGVDNILRITPLRPLEPKTKYLVVITNDIVDIDGEPVEPSVSYVAFRDALDPLIDSFEPVRQAVQGWESLAAGYFSFMQTAFEANLTEFSAPADDSIAFSMTFTTGGTTDVLTSMVAPESFFEESLSLTYKKEAIVNLVQGTYNLTADSDGLSGLNASINNTLNFLLTDTVSPLYNATIAGAIEAGASYSDLSADSSAAFLMQSAAAQAALLVQDAATEALETVAGLAALAAVPENELFAIPTERETNFFRVDAATDLFESLSPSIVYQGEITLPSYQALPTDTSGGIEILTSQWAADTTIRSMIDTSGTETTDVVSYRYPFAAKQADVTIPLTAVLPDTALTLEDVTNVPVKPENGWPVVIFVHGIFSDRSNALVPGSVLANACTENANLPCFATLAIDQPLHGVAPSGSSVSGLISATDPNTSITPNIADHTPSTALTERHFDYAADDVTGLPVAMDYSTTSDGSGELFLNLTNFAVARDNLRQMTLDLMNLSASIDAMDVDGDGVADDLDPTRVYIIGHSLGGISSIPFVAVNNSDAVQGSMFNDQPFINASAFMTTGGGIPRLLTNSQSYSGRVLGGLRLASDELAFGQSGLESYLGVFQGVLDAVDPINFAASLSDANSTTGVLLAEIVGDGTATSPSDVVIPNGADADKWGSENAPLNGTVSGVAVGNFSAPLSGTEPLIEQFGAVKSAEATSDGDAGVLVTRFIEGGHSTPVNPSNTDVDPFTSAAAFQEMMTEILVFFASEGDVSGSIVVDSGVVEE